MSMHKALATSVLVTSIAAATLAAGCKKADPKDAPPAGSAAGAPAMAAKTTPGVTAAEIKIGQSMPYSGPASAFGALGKGAAAYFKMVNDNGGINGRKVTLISLDDGYSPSKAVENVRKLVESDGVAAIFNNVGTANNKAVQKYLNDKKVPQLFVATAAEGWADPEHYPWTIGFAPSYRIEAKTYAKYLMKEKPNAKLCVLYQNDDFGKEYLTGLKEGFGDKHDAFVAMTASYEVTDPTIDSQAVRLQSAGCDTLLSAVTPKFGAQIIRKVFDLGWKPLHLLSAVSISRAAVLAPAGLDKAKGVVTAGYIKDIADPKLADDPGMNEYRAFAKKYLPEIDLNDGNYVYAFGVSITLAKVLTQCGDDLSRENIMKQAANIKDLQLPVIIDGIKINTSPTDFRPYQQLQLAQFNGNNFEPMSDIISEE